MIRTYKRKLILTKGQEQRINSWIGACRVVYNLGLEIKITGYRSTGKTIHRFCLEKQLKDVRKDFDWLNDTPYGRKLYGSVYNDAFQTGVKWILRVQNNSEVNKK